MGRRRLTAGLTAVFTLAVVALTAIFERLDRDPACIPGDDSCEAINDGHVLVFALAGYVVWVFGLFAIVFLMRRFAKRNAQPS